VYILLTETMNKMLQVKPIVIYVGYYLTPKSNKTSVGVEHSQAPPSFPSNSHTD